MFQPLPADTVFEAKQRALSNTRILMGVLGAIYLVGFNLIAVLLFCVRLDDSSSAHVISTSPSIFGWASTLAIVVAALHYLYARSQSLDHLLARLGTRAPDVSDEAHNRFIHAVEEAGIAIGRVGIRPVVIPTSALNAFSVEGADGGLAIGVTEGALARFTRPELEAVVAHEASHLAHGDSRLLAIACSLFAVFGMIAQLRAGRGRDRSGGAVVLVVLVAMLARFLSQLACMAISRSREYYADSEAVHMCKNPLALADALNKIATRDRGYLAIPEGFSAMFIMNPELNARDERDGFEADLLSTHPPVQSRIKKLMEWAQREAPTAEDAQTRPLFIHDEGAWRGPVTQDAAAAGDLKPDTWVVHGNSIVPAASIPGLKDTFGNWKSDKNVFQCPRCTTPLVEEMYEGIAVHRCTWCKGRLLPAEGLTRAILRRQAAFDPMVVAEVLKWRKVQLGTLRDLCKMPHVDCPLCKDPMSKRLHTEVTRVIIDVCQNSSCGAIWCDPGELEKIEILIEVNDKPES